MGSLKFLESNILIMIWFNQLVWLLHLTLTSYSYYSPKELFKKPIKFPALCSGSSWPPGPQTQVTSYRLQVTGYKSTSSILCMSLSSFWEWEKGLTPGVFNHFTSKHLTRAPWFVSTSSALLCKKAWSEQMDWARSLLTRVMQGRSPHLALQKHPWAGPLRQSCSKTSFEHFP